MGSYEEIIFATLDAMNLRLAFQETMAHLKYIESQGKLNKKFQK